MAASSSAPSNGEWKYDVFLSFRGEDTRNNFTSHLYAALSRRKIETFIDYELRRGDEISPALLKAIEESSLSIETNWELEEAFAKHEKQLKKTKEKAKSWRATLTQVANLSGWHIQQHDGSESELVENIVKEAESYVLK
ncbi:TMV resistance protein N-like [Pistacia vera]|uniref:TMV resistance protein N-like n=1 Tax=Pistacia vera TaxID=55513 RepID=UPI0012635295|nr:TMV resistance protein N-like [Pistacia vera]